MRKIQEIYAPLKNQKSEVPVFRLFFLRQPVPVAWEDARLPVAPTAMAAAAGILIGTWGFGVRLLISLMLFHTGRWMNRLEAGAEGNA